MQCGNAVQTFKHKSKKVRKYIKTYTIIFGKTITYPAQLLLFLGLLSLQKCMFPPSSFQKNTTKMLLIYAFLIMNLRSTKRCSIGPYYTCNVQHQSPVVFPNPANDPQQLYGSNGLAEFTINESPGLCALWNIHMTEDITVVIQFGPGKSNTPQVALTFAGHSCDFGSLYLWALERQWRHRFFLSGEQSLYQLTHYLL